MGSVTGLPGMLPMGGSGVNVNAAVNVTTLKEADGTPDNKSQVQMKFSIPVKVKDAKKIVITAMATDPITMQQKQVNIPVLSASIDPNNASMLNIKTGGQVPTGATISIQAGALTNASGTAVAPKNFATTNGTAVSDFTMTRRGFKPTNVNLFTKDAFPTATIPANAPVQAYSEAQIKSELQVFLQKKINAGKLSVAEATSTFALFSSAQTKAIIPDPKIRAGLLSLAGTSASGAINTILTSANQSGKPYAKVDFDASFTGAFAAASGNANGTRVIKITPGMKGESFQAIGSLLAHEAIHQDNVNGQNEEVLAETARTVSWAENVLIDPTLTQKNTPLVRANNTLLLAMLNSGNTSFPKAGLTSAPQLQPTSTAVASKVFVGGSEKYLSFDNFTRTNAALTGISDVDTVGNTYLTSFVSKTNKSNVTGNGFTRNTRDLIDANQAAISNTDSVKLASILKLNIQ